MPSLLGVLVDGLIGDDVLRRSQGVAEPKDFFDFPYFHLHTAPERRKIKE